MFRTKTTNRLLLAPLIIRNAGSIQTAIQYSRPYATVQSVTSASFWKSLIPKPLRSSSPPTGMSKLLKSKEWNPATFFIAIFLLIGSMSIQMIALRNTAYAFSRRADAKIGLLKEIVQRIQDGETVDVEGLLGTGDAKRETEWEEVLREIEDEDQAWADSRKPKSKNDAKSASSAVTNLVESKVSEVAKGNAPEGFY